MGSKSADESAVAPDYPRISDYPPHYARTVPEREALVLDGRGVSYAALAASIDRCARALLAHGVRKGDRVAMLSTPRPEYLTVFLATARVGAIWMGLNPVHQLDEHRYVIGDCRPRLLFGFADLRGRDNREALRRLKAEFACIEKLVILDRPEGEAEKSYEMFLAGGDSLPQGSFAAEVDAVTADDVALICHTSGSSGQPKGAMITHRNLVHCARVQFELFPPRPLRVLCNLPVNHVASTSDICAHTLVGGGTLVFQERFDAAGALDIVQASRVSILMQLPTMLLKMIEMQEVRARDISSLQAVLFFGAPMVRDKIVELQKFGATVFTSWGMTETSCSVTYTSPADDLDVLANSVGRPARGCELRIVDGDGKDVIGTGAGEVVVRGTAVMAGYYNRPEATREAIDADGWLHSGDLGRIDEAGCLRLAGRMKDMFKSGGYNIYPREVEAVIEAHPDVMSAALIPVPDALYQEVGFVFVRRRPDRSVDAAALDGYCRDRLANYKIPKRFIVREDLPLLPIGKIDKGALQEEALRMLQELPKE
jgi:acyl-CoA synthetase (AMP-forming)/AMP-acid ligase II